MNFKRAFIILAILVALLFVINALTPGGIDLRDPADIATSSDDGVAPATSTEPIAGIPVEDAFSNGTHTYSFTLYLPTPCHSFSTPDVAVAESFPEQIAIDLSIVAPAPGTMCAQVITAVPLSVSATASEGARLTQIRVDGNDIPFTIVSTNN